MTTSGLPTARHHFPTGIDRQACIDYNRVLKVARITAKALELGCDQRISDAQMDAIAHEIGAIPPGSSETRAAIRAALSDVNLLTVDSSDADIASAVVEAAGDGRPFRYRDGRAHTVLLIALPVER